PPLPRLVAGRVVQEDEAPGGGLLLFADDGRGHGERVRGESVGRTDLLQFDLGARPCRTKAADGLGEERGYGGRGRHDASVFRRECSWGNGTPASPGSTG